MIRETARLELRSLGPDELRLWLEDLPALERCGSHLFRRGDTLWWKTEKGDAGFEH